MLGTELSIQLSLGPSTLLPITPAPFSVSKPNTPNGYLGDTWIGLNFGLAFESY